MWDYTQQGRLGYYFVYSSLFGLVNASLGKGVGGGGVPKLSPKTIA